MDRLVGLDFGGTSIKAGAIIKGEIVGELSESIPLERGADRVLDLAAEMARELGAEDRVGIGCAGLIDRNRGVLLRSPNLVALVGCALSSGLARRLSIDPSKVLLENDANVAALGEQRCGAAKDLDDFLMITLGTGVGGGLVLGGELYTGSGGMAGEVGHMVVYHDDERKEPQGSLEHLASATAAIRRARDAGLPPEDPGNLEKLCGMARREGGEGARQILFQVGFDLGLGLSFAEALLDLRHYVFAGGFSAALDLLAPGIHAGMHHRRFGDRVGDLRAATLGSSAGWIGAAYLGVPR